MFPQLKQHQVILISLIGMTLILIPHGSDAQTAQRPAARPAQRPSAPPTAAAPRGAPENVQREAPQDQTAADKIDVTDLENKYWAAKDTDFSVVQNRLYSKARRFSLSGMYGTLVNDPWNEGAAYGGSLAYYFNERWGIETSYSQLESRDNKGTQKLAQQGGLPNYNKMKTFYGGSLVWVPLYAKMSLLNWTIIYFDMSFALGGGVQEYQQQRDDGAATKTTPAVTFDVTQTFFLSKYIAFRLDLKNRWYREETAWYRSSSAATAGTRTVSTDTNNTTLLMLGLTLLY